MKTVLCFVAGFVIWLVLIAAVCWFTQWGETPDTWSDGGRLGVAMVMTVGGCLGGVACAAISRGEL